DSWSLLGLLACTRGVGASAALNAAALAISSRAPARGARERRLFGGVPVFRRLIGDLTLAVAVLELDVQAERAHLLHEHVEALRNAGLERVVAAHDRLVDLGAAG